MEGYWKEEHCSSAKCSEHDDGINLYGKHKHSCVLWAWSNDKQHLQSEETSDWFSLWSRRGICCGTKICNHLYNILVLFSLSLSISWVSHPVEHPRLLTTTCHQLGYSRSFDWSFEKSFNFEYCGRQTFTHRTFPSAMDLWTCHRILLFCCHVVGVS